MSIFCYEDFEVELIPALTRSVNQWNAKTSWEENLFPDKIILSMIFKGQE